MPLKKSPEELARVGRSPGRDSGGRVIGATSANGVCPHVMRRLARAKRILNHDTYDIYVEAIERIDAQTPHCGGYHGIPDDDWLDDIAIVERAVNTVVPPELELHSSDLYSLIDASPKPED